MTACESCGSTTTSHKHGWLRWAVLLAMSLVVFGGYYVYDAISPMKNAMESELSISPSDFGWLVSFYALPNLLGITLLGGILIDKKGIRFAGMLFVITCAVGAFITALGGSNLFAGSRLAALMDGKIFGWSAQLQVMILGRFIFGFGGEIIIVAQNKVISRWFKDEELALAFGLNLVICRLGTIAALSFSSLILGHSAQYIMTFGPDGPGTMILRYPGLPTALWLSSIIMLLSVGAFFLYLTLDRTEVNRSPQAKEDAFQLSDIVKLLKSRPFIYITILCLTFYSTVFPFLSYATDILINKYGLPVDRAGIYTSIVTWATILFTPLSGLMIDRFGKRSSLMIYGSILLILVHLTIGFTTINPIIPMAFLGLAFSLVPAAMWPSVPMIVDEKKLGTAYGLMAQIQCLGLWGVPILMGLVLTATNKGVTARAVTAGEASWDYRYVMLMMAAIGTVGLVFAILLKRGERSKHGIGLELPSGARK
ncbi:MFS transporter [Myxococcota bacterium]|nr:MFS transporter [Myxococcota bacterium]MBU1534606.1 MFS transporter [Myxococcota bacterium]